VCVCVCNFELFMAVKKHILGQRVGRQSVLCKCTTSRSTNTMSVPTGFPLLGPSFPIYFQDVRTEKVGVTWTQCHGVSPRCLHRSQLLRRHSVCRLGAVLLGIVGTRWRSRLWHCATSRKVLDLILPAAMWPGIDSASNRNEYQGYILVGKCGRCFGLAT
jgi:hypothetical protein